MDLKQLLLEQVEQEAALTRKAIDRVPEGRNDFKPHEKSMTLGYLASLVASMVGWVPLMVERDEFNFDDPSSEVFKNKPAATRAELIQKLDDGLASARRALAATNEQHLLTTWRFIVGGRVVDERPRYVMISDAVCSHLAHHRGQLTVYLRLNEASVPALYGPSADEMH